MRKNFIRGRIPRAAPYFPRVRGRSYYRGRGYYMPYNYYNPYFPYPRPKNVEGSHERLQGQGEERINKFIM